MLHIVTKSPYEKNALDSCLRVAQAGNAVLLIEDGVYAAVRGGNAAEKLQKAAASLKLYALAPDIEARGMKERVIDGVTLVDYAGFVELVTSHPTNQSWL
ncbi:MAG: sulfurtransferase complex subunit TusB [Betaproteobacteria bacterium]|nr:sulfurtransferase complex subunit TusB [Betaproteobacteria bacterium]